jgi:hypothetical protein
LFICIFSFYLRTKFNVSVFHIYLNVKPVIFSVPMIRNMPVRSIGESKQNAVVVNDQYSS